MATPDDSLEQLRQQFNDLSEDQKRQMLEERRKWHGEEGERLFLEFIEHGKLVRAAFDARRANPEASDDATWKQLIEEELEKFTAYEQAVQKFRRTQDDQS